MEHNQSSRRAFLSAGPYEFLGDSRYCTLTQAPAQHTYTLTPLTQLNTHRLMHRHIEIFLYVHFTISPNDWHITHEELMILWKRGVINSNRRSF